MTVREVYPEEKISSSSLLHRSLNDSPHLVEKAIGSYLYLQNGTKILDSCGGAAVISVGHLNQTVIDRMADQLRCLTYVHTLEYTSSPSEILAEKLLENYHDQIGKVFFATSGSEASEGAYKLAIQYFFERGLTTKTKFISRNQSYHGNCLAGLSLSGHKGRRAPYEHILNSDFHKISDTNEYRGKLKHESTDDYVKRLVDELESKILEIGPENVAGFFAETIVGATAGCVLPPKNYFKGIRQICDKYDVLLILDEVMCGSGRTGTFFAWEQEDIVPDITCSGKALSSGYAPLSAIFIGHKIIKTLSNGSSAFNNGHTYQSFPLSCAAANVVQDIISENNLLQNVKNQGNYLGECLSRKLQNLKSVGNIRGRGLFWAIEFVKDKLSKEPFDPSVKYGYRVQKTAWSNGLAVYPGSGTIDGHYGDHILIAPSFDVSEDLIETITNIIAQSIQDCENKYLHS
ncbi:PLP-dependent transferase [Hyphopichia burtonii NRRL Y-1933]|uniref:PLP-dependent transferase n=1 Tax=Hyphopichia burtonii NRRL Y-1933 TaxID=984485 RepID=A0A1E4RCN9_9ASCO|nr:PLP-dependent transferase [Hyphopichia burtonii NRRL Y-1933]ODV65022.1 PLP-dependent transferase [Hyphopichia burtonii NRRL Y-1933]